VNKAQALYQVDGRDFRIIATYGFDHCTGNRRPHFSITGEVHEKVHGFWKEDCCGAIHAHIAEYLPEVAPLLKYHLSDDEGLPMHYLANGLYWLEHVHGVSEWPFDKYGAFAREGKTPQSVFEDHVRWGYHDMDTEEVLSELYLSTDKELHELLIGVDSERLHPGDEIKMRRKILHDRARSPLASRCKALDDEMRTTLEAAGVEYMVIKEA